MIQKEFEEIGLKINNNLLKESILHFTYKKYYIDYHAGTNVVVIKKNRYNQPGYITIHGEVLRDKEKFKNYIQLL